MIFSACNAIDTSHHLLSASQRLILLPKILTYNNQYEVCPISFEKYQYFLYEWQDMQLIGSECMQKWECDHCTEIINWKIFFFFKYWTMVKTLYRSPVILFCSWDPLGKNVSFYLRKCFRSILDLFTYITQICQEVTILYLFKM